MLDGYLRDRNKTIEKNGGNRNMTKRITSFVHHTTGEGSRISYTYSVIDGKGNLVKENMKDTLVVVDEDIKNAINMINDYLLDREV